MTFLGGPPIDLKWFGAGSAFWSNVDDGESDECWKWTQSTGSHGYGQTWDGVTVRLAHRVAWALHTNSQIPPGMTIDHICRNRICVNPAHLQLMTNEENARMNGASLRTHCPRGHAYDEPNTYIQPSTGHRRCRRCAQERRL